jgi:hypothetical protein
MASTFCKATIICIFQRTRGDEVFCMIDRLYMCVAFIMIMVPIFFAFDFSCLINELSLTKYENFSSINWLWLGGQQLKLRLGDDYPSRWNSPENNESNQLEKINYIVSSQTIFLFRFITDHQNTKPAGEYRPCFAHHFRASHVSVDLENAENR